MQPLVAFCPKLVDSFSHDWATLQWGISIFPHYHPFWSTSIMSNLSIILQELQAKAMRGEMRQMREEQQLLAEQFVGLVNNFTMLGDDLHASFLDWGKECEENVIEKVTETLIPQFDVLVQQIPQTHPCNWWVHCYLVLSRWSSDIVPKVRTPVCGKPSGTINIPWLTIIH